MTRIAGIKQSTCILSGLAGVCGVLLLAVSFAINTGPPPRVDSTQLAGFAQQNFARILWGAWMQAVGPVLIVLFAFFLVHAARATLQLTGWMTFFGATVLMTVSLIEITFYIGALYRQPATMPSISLNLIAAVQHLYFMVAAPAMFLPLGIILIRSRILPKLFGYLALALAATFAILAGIFLFNLTLPDTVTAFAGVQALWWLAGGITVIVRSGRISGESGNDSIVTSA